MPSFNQFMHPRNLYKNKPDFSELAAQYPSLQQFLIPSPHSQSKVTIDFGNPIALKTLTQALFKCHWNLDVQLPDNRLIPAIPQRLNYILWIEDLVNDLIDINYETGTSTVTGIDIGTGASCVFPLLICRKNPSWHMVAFESDSFSTQIALANLTMNQLTQRVTLINTSEWFSHLIQQGVQLNEPSVTSNGPHYHFVICNPPFFPRQPLNNVNGSFHHEPNELQIEMQDFDGICEPNNDSGSSLTDPDVSREGTSMKPRGKGRKNTRSKSSANTSCPSDSVTSGGEVEFVRRLIAQSVQVAHLVDLFTVMLGCKESLTVLKKELNKFKSENDQLCFNWTQFCQGRVMRWGLVWSFTKNVSSSSVNRVCSHKLPKKSAELSFDLPEDVIAPGLDVVSGCTDILVDVLVRDLDIKTFAITKLTPYSSTVVVKSNVNTWSHQRRKRRQLQRQQQQQQQQQDEHPEQKESSQLKQPNCHQLHPQHGQDTQEDEMVIETTQGTQVNAEQGTKSSESINNSLNHLSRPLPMERVASALPSSSASTSTFQAERSGEEKSEYSCYKRKVDERDSFDCHFDGTNDKVTGDTLTCSVQQLVQVDMQDGHKKEQGASFAQQKAIEEQMDARSHTAVPFDHTSGNNSFSPSSSSSPSSPLSQFRLSGECNFTRIVQSSGASYCYESPRPPPPPPLPSASSCSSRDCYTSKRLKEPIFSDTFKSSAIKNKPLLQKCQELKSKRHSTLATGTQTDDILYLLSCTVKLIRSIDGPVKLIVHTNENSLGHESTYQMFQYLKNRFSSLARPSSK